MKLHFKGDMRIRDIVAISYTHKHTHTRMMLSLFYSENSMTSLPETLLQLPTFLSDIYQSTHSLMSLTSENPLILVCLLDTDERIQSAVATFM